MSLKLALAALAAAAPAVHGLGQAIVKNQCDFPVYLWSVGDTDGPMQTLDANSGSFSEDYRTNANGGGVSIKISRDQSQSSITQFEYTLAGSLWYDVSNINGYPFEDWGLSLQPSGDGCRSIVCAPGVESCSGVYNVPSDNHATAACSADSDATLVLCSSQQGGSDGGSDTSSDPAPPASTPAPVVQEVASAVAPAVTEAAQAVAPVVDNSNNNVFTTLVTQWVTVDSEAAAATPAPAPASQDDNSDVQWFGHHVAGWNPNKAKRHVHHPHSPHYARN